MTITHVSSKVVDGIPTFPEPVLPDDVGKVIAVNSSGDYILTEQTGGGGGGSGDIGLKLDTMTVAGTTDYPFTSPVLSEDEASIVVYLGRAALRLDEYTIVADGGNNILQLASDPAAAMELYVLGSSVSGGGGGGGDGNLPAINTGDKFKVVQVNNAETDAEWINGGDVQFATWTSERTAKMRERSRRVAHLDDFAGADPTGANTSHAAIKRMLQQSQTARVWAEMPAGNFAITETLGMFDGLRLRGVGNGFWRSSPFSWWTPDEVDDPMTTKIIMCDTGPKTYQFPDIGRGRQNGYNRVNPSALREYNNGFDSNFDLFSGIDFNGSGTTKANLLSFSAALKLGSDDNIARPSQLENLMFVVNCPGLGNTVGVRGYGEQSAIVPYADWDIGLILAGASMTEIKNVNVVGYYAQRGVIMTPVAANITSQGQGEHVHWNGGYIQGGLAIRASDGWPIIAKTSTTIDVRWANHTFNASGTLYISNGPGNITYTGLTFVAGSPGVLRFTGVSSTADIVANSSYVDPLHGNAGVSHSHFENMYIADHGHSTRLEGPNDAFNNAWSGSGDRRTTFRAAIEASGDPCRAMKFTNVTAVVHGPVGYHFGAAQNIEFYGCYIEPKRYKLTLGGADQPQGALIIAGPQLGFETEMVGWGECSMSSYGNHFVSYCRRTPLVRSPTIYRPLINPTNAIAGEVFNTYSYRDDRVQQLSGEATTANAGTNDYFVQGLNGCDTALQRRDTNGTPAGLKLRQNDAYLDLPLNGQLPAYTAAQIASAAHSVNTTEKRAGKQVWDTTNFRIMVAAASAATATWRVCDGSAAVTPS